MYNVCTVYSTENDDLNIETGEIQPRIMYNIRRILLNMMIY